MDPPSPGDQGEASQPLDWRFAQVFGERAAGEDVQEGTYVRARARAGARDPRDLWGALGAGRACGTPWCGGDRVGARWWDWSCAVS